MSRHFAQDRSESELLWFQRRSFLAAAASWTALGGMAGAQAQARSNIVELVGDAQLNGVRLRPEQTIQTGDSITTGPALVRDGFSGDIWCTPATADLVRILLLVPFDHRRPFMIQRHHRHAPAARGLDALHCNVEDLAGAGEQGEVRGQLSPIRVLRQYWATLAINPQDQRGLFEIAHHDGDAAVCDKMRMGLIPRAAEIEIGNPAG